MFNSRGMVQFGEETYRIAEVGRGKYEAFRILDNVRIGTFETTPSLRVNAPGADERVLFAVARTALMQAKTTWPAIRPMADGAAMSTAAAVVRRRATTRVLPRHRSSRPWFNSERAMFVRLWRRMLPLPQPAVYNPA